MMPEFFTGALVYYIVVALIIGLIILVAMK